MIGIIPLPGADNAMVEVLQNALIALKLPFGKIDPYNYPANEVGDYNDIVYIPSSYDMELTDNYSTHALKLVNNKWMISVQEDLDFDKLTVDFDRVNTYVLSVVTPSSQSLPLIRRLRVLYIQEYDGEDSATLDDPVSVLQLAGSAAEVHRDISALSFADHLSAVSRHLVLLRRRNG